MSIINRIPNYLPGRDSKYTEMSNVITPSVAGSWVTYNVNTLFSIPKSSVLEVICTNEQITSSTSNNIGVSEVGGNDNRYLPVTHVWTNDINARHGYRTFVNVDSSGNIRGYAETTSNAARIFIIGYWEDVTFTEDFDTVTYTSSEDGDGNWYSTGSIATTFTKTANAIGNIVMGVTGLHSKYVGIRAVGSSLDRRIFLGRSNTPGQSSVSYMVKNDASGHFEYQSGGQADVEIYYMGHFTSATMDYVEKLDDNAGYDDNSWQNVNWTVAGGTGIHDNVADNLSISNKYSEIGFREFLSGNGRKYFIDYAGSDSFSYGWNMSSNVNSSGYMKYYIGDPGSSTDHMYLLGYFKPV